MSIKIKNWWNKLSSISKQMLCDNHKFVFNNIPTNFQNASHHQIEKIYLREVAKNLFFDKTKNNLTKENFVKTLNTTDVVDIRKKGYICTHCKKIKTNPTAFTNKNEVVILNNLIYISNTHYDGCLGWD